MKKRIVTATLNPALDKTVLVEDFQVGGLNRVQSVAVEAGGKGINVAKVLKNFNMDVVAAGILGKDNGSLLLEELDHCDIPADFLQAPGTVRTNLKIVDTLRGVTTEINEKGFEVGREMLQQFTFKLSNLLDKASILVLSGSLPPGIPVDTYGKFIEAAKQRGVRTLLDADGEAFAEGVKGLPYAVKPNLYELERYAGESLENDEMILSAARGLIQKGISLVVVSMGKQGAIIVNAEEAYRTLPFAIEPQCTVGAGDAMVAALACAMLESRTFRETAAWVTAAGTLAASKPGNRGCTLAEVHEALARVQVVEL